MMRYADYAYAHISNPEHQAKDPGRSAAINRRAEKAGFSNGPDYLDNVMKRLDTRSFEGSGGRTNWVNAKERLTGWNHANEPTQSTVIPAKTPEAAEDRFDRSKKLEAEKLGLRKDQLQEKGPISQHDRPTSQDYRPGEAIGSASKPRDQAQILKEAQDKQRDKPDQKLTPEQRREALKEAEAKVEKNQAALKETIQKEKDPKRKEQLYLKADIEQADFNRHSARERGDLAKQEKGPQSIDALKAKRQGKEADKAYDKGVSEWHKRSVRDSKYERFDDKWSKEANRAQMREAKSNEPQSEKNKSLDRQFARATGHGKSQGMGM